jgi:branched-chain amino acid aminotransferase
MAPARAKITGAYINSALAKSEALMNGFDEAIMLSHDGHVSEGSAANLFLVRDGVMYTPDSSQNVLEGITRHTITRLAIEELGLTVVARSLDKSELYTADELFLTGTAAGITFINSVDHRQVGTGAMGPVTRELDAHFTKITLGTHPKFTDALTPVYASKPVGAR